MAKLPLLNGSLWVLTDVFQVLCQLLGLLDRSFGPVAARRCGQWLATQEASRVMCRVNVFSLCLFAPLLKGFLLVFPDFIEDDLLLALLDLLILQIQEPLLLFEGRLLSLPLQLKVKVPFHFILDKFRLPLAFNLPSKVRLQLSQIDCLRTGSLCACLVFWKQTCLLIREL